MWLYVLIGLILASFIIAFFSAKTWHWGHVIVVLGIVLATGGFFILAAETLRINSVYRTAIKNKTTQLEDVTVRNDALEKGTDDATVISKLASETEPEVAMPENAESIPSLSDLDHQLLIAKRLRGRVWRKVAPAGADPANAGMKITFQGPAPAGLSPETIVYVFEEGEPQLPAADGSPQGPQYLGEFRVAAVSGQQATIVPIEAMDEFEQRRLTSSRGPWSLYETIPPDRYEVFAGKNEAELRKKLPAQSVEEYIRHGKEAAAADDETRKLYVDETGLPLPADKQASAAKVLYQRRLRDYAVEFDELSNRRLDMEVTRSAVRKDIDRLTAALASAKELQAFRQKEVERLKLDLTGVTKERVAIQKHLAQIRQQVANLQKQLAETLRLNSELADRLNEIQLGAAG
jgi:hypothetical protein